MPITCKVWVPYTYIYIYRFRHHILPPGEREIGYLAYRYWQFLSCWDVLMGQLGDAEDEEESLDVFRGVYQQTWSGRWFKKLSRERQT